MYRGQRGISMLEVMVASAILGVAGVGILLALTTAFRAQDITSRDVTAENLARNALEEIRSSDPQYQASYTLTIAPPQGYVVTIKTEAVCPSCYMDDGVTQWTDQSLSCGQDPDVVILYSIGGTPSVPPLGTPTIPVYLDPVCAVDNIQQNTVTVSRDGRPLVVLTDLKTRR